MTVYIRVTLERQSAQSWRIRDRGARCREIVSCHLMAGQYDYMLVARVAGIDDYGRLHQNELSRLPGVTRLETSFALRDVLEAIEVISRIARLFALFSPIRVDYSWNTHDSWQVAPRMSECVQAISRSIAICLFSLQRSVDGIRQVEPWFLVLLAVSICVLAWLPQLRAEVPTPVSVLGHTPGDDFYLADYEDTIRYFHALAAASDRMKMFTVGKTTRGKDIEVAVISSPQNLAKLDDYKQIAGRLAHASDLNDDQAQRTGAHVEGDRAH